MRNALSQRPWPLELPTAKILVIDDDAVDRARFERLLDGAGHQLIFAGSGENGLALFEQQQPDLVILDVNLPGADGIEVAQRMRDVAGEAWLPLIFVTGQMDVSLLERCFDAGGTDFVYKDVSEAELGARVASVLRQGSVQAERKRQLEELAYHRDMAAKEEKIAQKIFRSIMARERLEMPGVRYRLSAMSVFNGDLLLAARTPDGGIHILIGDFTGHGLSAAIGTLPASEIFYAMSAKGFGIVDVLREINRRLKRLLPVGMFMVGAGVQIDKTGTSALIWSGGIPDVLLRRVQGGDVERIPARHLPLGVLDPEDFLSEAEIVSLNEGDRLFMFTDGVTETERADRGMFGIDRVVEVVADGADAGVAFDNLNTALEEFRAGYEQSDDVTLIEYTCPPPQDFDNALPKRPGSGYDTEFNSEWQFRLHLDPAALKTFDPRPLVTQILMDIQGLYDDREPLYTIISECFRICLEQGVLEVDLPSGSDGDEPLGYQREVAERLARLEHRAIHIDIDHAAAHDGGMLMLQFNQNGRALTTVDCPTLESLARICESVRLEGDGHRIVATYLWKSV